MYFPFCASCGLVMPGNSGNLRHLAAGSEQMRRFNLNLADRCQQFVIWRDKALVSSLVAHLKLADKEWVPKMRVS